MGGSRAAAGGAACGALRLPAVQPGDAFVCIRGSRLDGHDFAGEAAERGAVLILAERAPGPVVDRVPTLLVADSRAALGQAAAVVLGHPDRRLRLVGVTGTNGKTTTTYLTKAVLEAAGYRVGLIGTIQQLVGDQVLGAERTTPESADLQDLFARMVAVGASHAVTEVSSHAVVLKRIEAIEYDVGIFTNLTQDHLDFHGTMEAYREAKAGFFATLSPGTKGRKLAVINGDDPSGAYMAARSTAPALFYGLEPGRDVTAEAIEARPDGLRFTVRTPWGASAVRLQLGGAFNVYNALGALGAGLHEGVPLAEAVAALERVRGVPGRFEAVREGQPFGVIVDYAHTPDGLDNVLTSARALGPRRLWVVFGCGGDRDRTKRPKMGAIAARLADWVIITSDNPRSEDPEAICREVEAGLLAQRASSGPVAMQGYDVVVDRREAIAQAVRRAQPGDLVVVAGKGHETYQILKDRIVPFDDRQVVREALRELGYGAPAPERSGP
ncbi:UDP-N-acetylmuramoyl-L-alanyl-D-glutamate--2,6-diaminopimelate ligase [Geochorda subterranea]|uniref:UDP-N-acetylmuramoyl-L-alanyl-D-glutamate--2,6-diaminopimelate ligase n=1 Tax=Geochorda subterranea TaxID=3109564 RepID=A0ABZ1BT79_9FIRM|nr:UDP-N-acetylmuramoyl-L-alanyl-D-glutamate--2,6-diaminopimelate ligase [Limnochorda sp. LNt]WRP15833.1 UDP-N-acetylmuramoyl-L-alanyl-D-glutamate--2,6-diaminopimelate ligase [Limnochorda sp. LNt]